MSQVCLAPPFQRAMRERCVLKFGDRKRIEWGAVILDRSENVMSRIVRSGTERRTAPLRLAQKFQLREHADCERIGAQLRGTLCEQLAQRPGRRLVPGEFVYLVEAEAKSLFFLKHGLIKTSRIAPDGRELILHIHHRGDVFGELCFCTGTRREQAVVLEPSEIVELPLGELLGQLQRNPDAMLDLLELMAERLNAAQSMLQSVAFDTTMARLIQMLLAMGERLGVKSGDAQQIPHHITHEELAELIGSRRVVVSSLLNQLRALGLIEYRRKGALTLRPIPLQALLDYMLRARDT
jgi:CRP/FNR family transcriptional regulator